MSLFGVMETDMDMEVVEEDGESEYEKEEIIEKNEEMTIIDRDMIEQDRNKVVQHEYNLAVDKDGALSKCYYMDGRDLVINENVWKCELEINI